MFLNETMQSLKSCKKYAVQIFVCQRNSSAYEKYVWYSAKCIIQVTYTPNFAITRTYHMTQLANQFSEISRYPMVIFLLCTRNKRPITICVKNAFESFVIVHYSRSVVSYRVIPGVYSITTNAMIYRNNIVFSQK